MLTMDPGPQQKGRPVELPLECEAGGRIGRMIPHWQAQLARPGPPRPARPVAATTTSRDRPAKQPPSRHHTRVIDYTDASCTVAVRSPGADTWTVIVPTSPARPRTTPITAPAHAGRAAALFTM